ncbi:hypothetical protein D9M70_429750 [compost metagenome]
MQPEQFRQQRHDALAAEMHRHRQAQAAPDLLFARFQQRLSGPDFAERPQAVFVEELAFVGQALGAGGAMEEANAQPLFQLGDRFSDCRARQVEPFGRRRKAAGVGRFHEHRNSVQVAHVCILSGTNMAKSYRNWRDKFNAMVSSSANR